MTELLTYEELNNLECRLRSGGDELARIDHEIGGHCADCTTYAGSLFVVCARLDRRMKERNEGHDRHGYSLQRPLCTLRKIIITTSAKHIRK